MLYRLVERIAANEFLRYFFSFAALFFLLVSPTSDTDLGWRLKYGEYLWQNQNLLRQDIFSWTLPQYPWFDISWLFNLLEYLLFTQFGFIALSFFGGLLIISCFYFVTKAFKPGLTILWIVILLFYFYLGPMLTPGLRPQIITLLGISLLSLLVYEVEKGNYKKALLFPLVILAWVNLHGTFLLGLFIVFLYSLLKITELLLFRSSLDAKSLKNKIVNLSAGTILSAVVLVLQLDGPGLFGQIWQYLPTNRIEGVSEWYPISLQSEEWLLLIVWTILSLVIVLRKRRTVFGLYKALITLAFAFFAFNSRRMFGPFFLVTLPFFLEFLQEGKIFLKGKTANIVSFILIITFINYGFLVRFPQSKFLNISWADYCDLGAGCSVRAAAFLQKNPLPKKVFTYYNFGGFTIWHNPKSKIFVDGRMDQWKKDSYSPFVDHQTILYKGDLELFNKYNFDAAYLPTTLRLYFYLKRQVAEGKWEVIFEDEKAAIFVRKR
ncbi:hypothetical protein HY345_03585 [Candidatus Microgenomates bacterium]|nr:hypothetical protein [Candidatus Microgenomates bacterium]